MIRLILPLQPFSTVCVLAMLILSCCLHPRISLGEDSIADISLRSGGVLRGRVIKSPSDASPFYVIVTSDDITLKLAKSRVERVRARSPDLAEYEDELLPTMEDTVAAHLRMAKWCLDRKLTDQRRYHQYCVLRLDPDHEQTRNSLGYARRKDGRWLLREQLRAEQGWVRSGTRWVPREWVHFEEAETQQKQEQTKWRGDIKKWRKWMSRDKRAEAFQEIARIDDPNAAPELANALKKEKDPAIQMLYVETLGKLDVPAARRALIISAMSNDDVAIRETCLTILKRANRPGLANDFIRGLNPKVNPKNSHVNRAAIALGWLEATQAIKPLIDALVTEHRIANPAAQSGNFNVGNDTGGGFQFGKGAPKELISSRENRGVLDALRQLTNENFGFDQEAWIQWYARVNTPDQFDLRRNP